MRSILVTGARRGFGRILSAAVVHHHACARRCKRIRRLVSLLRRRPVASARDQATTVGSLGAKRLWLDVMSPNARTNTPRLAQGFIVEGRLRQRFEVDGHCMSLNVLSLLEREFRQEQKRAGKVV